MLTIDTLQKQKLILLDCISGSNAYGLALPHSDIDKRGIFFLPKSLFFGAGKVDQVSDKKQDVTYLELGHFFQLLIKNNPSTIELINIPPQHKHPFFDKIKKEDYLSKLCQKTFMGYALAQIKQAQGLSKKIFQPMSKKRKTILDFCYVPYKQGSILITEFLKEKNILPEKCGLAKIPHMPYLYNLYIGDSFNGIVQNKETSNEVTVSEIGKNSVPYTVISFNKVGYSKYCKEYKEYWRWVEKRNEERYQNNIAHGKNYDSKNMMHVFRLLAMAEEIASSKSINVHRKDRDYLLRIRKGAFSYEYLIAKSQEKMSLIEELFAKSDLPERPNEQKLNKLLIEFRENLY